MNDMTPTQALAALSELCHSRDDRAALSVIERHVQDMETALFNHGYGAGLCRCEWCAALPAREKGTE